MYVVIYMFVMYLCVYAMLYGVMYLCSVCMVCNLCLCAWYVCAYVGYACVYGMVSYGMYVSMLYVYMRKYALLYVRFVWNYVCSACMYVLYRMYVCM